MASVESLGLGSGVLTSDLVDDIISAEKEVSEARLDTKEELVDAKITAYGELQSLLYSIDASVTALSSSSLASSTTATSSDEDIVTATTSSDAEPGTYTIEVLNTAKAHAVASSTYTSYDEIIGSGQLTFSFGALTYETDGSVSSQDTNVDQASFTIDIDESNQTLSGIRDAINNADAGVSASIVNDGSGYRLLITSDETGEDYAMTITAKDSSGNLLTSGLADLAYNSSQTSASGMTETTAGEDAQLSVNGLTITRSSNSVDEVIDGVTLNLKSADVGKTVSIAIEADTEQVVEAIQAFVDAYNEFKTFADELTSYDADSEEAGLLLGDSTIRSIMQQIRSLISEPIVGLEGYGYQSLTELGVNTDKDNDYLLDFDSSVLEAAMSSDRQAVVGILSEAGSTTDSQISYINDSINTQPGTYDVYISQLATQAVYDGGSVAGLDFSSPVVIDDSNDGFTINVNGESVSVALEHGSYTSGDDLAKQIALQINSDSDLVTAGYSVSVAYSQSDSNFSITSNEYGSVSQVYFTSVDTNTANTLGFTTLNSGTYKGVELTTLNADAFNGKGATTATGSRTIDEDTGINFSSSNATFSLSVNGAAAVDVTVAQDASGQDLNGDGVYGDRADTLQAIQTAIDSTSLNGLVTAGFNDNGYLVFETTAEGSTESIEITSVGSSTSDTLLGLDATAGVQTNGKDPGVTLANDVSFTVQVDGISSATQVTVPSGVYLTGADLAQAVEDSLNSTLSTDASFSGLVTGAETTEGSRDISATIDFSTANAGFTLNVSGVEQEVLVNSNSGDNVADVQTALDNAFGAGVVTASMGTTGLVLTTDATGHTEYIEVVADGRGATTSSFADISAGYDFSSDSASFTLTVDGVDINVAVDGDGSVGSGDAASNLQVIQEALDDALVSSGQFSAGDITANVDDSGQLYFETATKEGIKTSATFGSSASIEVSAVSGSASTVLGMTAETSSNGYDGFGLTDTDRTYGYDLDAQVDYSYNTEDDLGSLSITIGGQSTTVGFTDLDSTAITYLGLQDVSVYSEEIPTGQDVEGTINGVEATGNGQYLKAVDGTVAATNGYYIAGEVADLTSGITLDASNSSFTINIDGVEAEVQLDYPSTYITGDALASALQEAINDTAEFSDADISVVVEYTSDASSYAYNKLGIISASTGSESVVEITDISTEAAAVFGFTKGIGDGEKGADQQGEIDDASGLRIKITGGNTGERGTVTYVSGFGSQLAELMESIVTDSDSIISNKLNSLNDDLDSIAEDRESLEIRMTAKEDLLKSKFLYNDSIIQTLNTTLDYIEQQFDALAASSD